MTSFDYHLVRVNGDDSTIRAARTLADALDLARFEEHDRVEEGQVRAGSREDAESKAPERWRPFRNCQYRSEG